MRQTFDSQLSANAVRSLLAGTAGVLLATLDGFPIRARGAIGDRDAAGVLVARLFRAAAAAHDDAPPVAGQQRKDTALLIRRADNCLIALFGVRTTHLNLDLQNLARLSRRRLIELVMSEPLNTRT